MGIKPPCKGCTKRYVDDTTTCHSTCKQYKEYVEQNKKVHDSMKKDNTSRALGNAK